MVYPGEAGKSLFPVCLSAAGLNRTDELLLRRGGLEGGGWVVTKRKCRLVSLSATQKTLLRKLERCDDMLRSS